VPSGNNWTGLLPESKPKKLIKSRPLLVFFSATASRPYRCAVEPVVAQKAQNWGRHRRGEQAGRESHNSEKHAISIPEFFDGPVSVIAIQALLTFLSV
jgi:hypothetical protein